jgi:hypothetical protein
MMLIALLISAAAVPAALMAEGDAANLAYLECLFSTSREAHRSDLSVSRFEATLASACRSEQRTADRTMARILALRGDGSATAHAQQTGEEVRQGMVADYRRVIELEPQLKAFAAMCKAHPEQCRE